MKRLTITPEFVEFVPRQLEEGILYISEEYGSASHLCGCGCGGKVVTPLSPTAWTLTKRGGEVSLYPSIGNWNLPCQSHYWIRGNRLDWSGKWSKEKIAAGFADDVARKERYYAEREDPQDAQPVTRPSWWSRFVAWWRGDSA